MKKLRTVILASALALYASVAVFPAQAADKPFTLKLSNVTSQNGKDAGVVFKEIVEKETEGSVKVNLFPDNQLGDDRTVVETTIFGDIDIVVSSTSPLATMFPDFYLFDAPFLFLTPQDAYTGLDGKVGEAILKGMESKGLKGLAFWENGFRNFTDNKVAVKAPTDVKSLKIRTMENEVHLAAWKAWGANPTPMAFSELFTALQQGTVDGQENPLGIIDGNKFQEVQKYLSMTQHVYTPYILAMNLEKFNALSDKQKAAILKAAKESTTFERKRSFELEGQILESLDKNKKITVIQLTPADKEPWRKLIMDAKIYDLVKKKMKNPQYLDELLKK